MLTHFHFYVNRSVYTYVYTHSSSLPLSWHGSAVHGHVVPRVSSSPRFGSLAVPCLGSYCSRLGSSAVPCHGVSRVILITARLFGRAVSRRVSGRLYAARLSARFRPFLADSPVGGTILHNIDNCHRHGTKDSECEQIMQKEGWIDHH